jgi:hypothetical protein
MNKINETITDLLADYMSFECGEDTTYNDRVRAAEYIEEDRNGIIATLITLLEDRGKSLIDSDNYRYCSNCHCLGPGCKCI